MDEADITKELQTLQMQNLQDSAFGSSSEQIYTESEMKKSIKELLEDTVVDNKLKDFPVFGFLTKSSKLTFIEKNEIGIFQNIVEGSLCKFYRSVPPCRHSDEMYLMADQMKVISMFNLRRSSGTENSNKINGRTALVTQIRQSLSQGLSGGSGAKNPNFIKRLFGMR